MRSLKNLPESSKSQGRGTHEQDVPANWFDVTGKNCLSSSCFSSSMMSFCSKCATCYCGWMSAWLASTKDWFLHRLGGVGRSRLLLFFFRWLFQPPQHTKPKDWSRIHLSTTAFSKRQSLIKPWFLELYVWGVAGWVLFAEFANMLLQKKIEFLDYQILANQLGKKSRNLMFAWILVFSHLKKIWPNWPRLFLLKTSSKQQNLAKKTLENRRAQLP